VTQTFSILAKRGVGKSYTASVMAEEMLKAIKAELTELNELRKENKKLLQDWDRADNRRLMAIGQAANSETLANYWCDKASALKAELARLKAELEKVDEDRVAITRKYEQLQTPTGAMAKQVEMLESIDTGRLTLGEACEKYGVKHGLPAKQGSVEGVWKRTHPIDS
jgi:chromosome segregation ATPase